MAIAQFYGQDAAGNWGLHPMPPHDHPHTHPDPPTTGGREYEWLVDVGSNWKRAGVSEKGWDKVDHVALVTTTLTILTVGCEEDPGAVEVRITVNGVVHSTHTFTDLNNVKTVSVPVTAGQPLRVEARSVSDPKAKNCIIVLA